MCVTCCPLLLSHAATVTCCCCHTLLLLCLCPLPTAPQAPKPPRRERLSLRLESDSTTLPQLPPRLRLRLPLDGFPDDTAGLN